MKQSFRTENASATVDENAILEIEFDAGKDISLSESKQIHNWVTSIVNDRKHYCVAYAKFGVTVDADVREWLSGEERLAFVAADAIIVSSLAQKIVANFYLKYNKPKQPTRAFTKVEDARRWILELIAQESNS